MRWVPWLLGIAGVVQYAILALLRPDGYVSLDMAYLVMWLAIVGALVVCYLSCYGCGGYGEGCDCCGPGCECGDGECCMPESNGHEHEHEHGEHEHPHTH